MLGLLEQRSPENQQIKLVIVRQQVTMKTTILRTRAALTLAVSTAGRAMRTTAVSATTILRHQRLTMMRKNLAKKQATVLL